MSATTTKGVPYPEPGDPANVPADLQALAAWADTHPGVTALTATQITALPAGQKWAGRAVWDTTNTRALIWDGAAWRRLTTETTQTGEWQSYTPVLSGGVTAAHSEGRYRHRGRACTTQVRLSFVSGASAAAITIGAPVLVSSATPIGLPLGWARATTLGGSRLQGVVIYDDIAGGYRLDSDTTWTNTIEMVFIAEHETS